MGVETILRASRLAATPAMTDDIQLSFNLPSVSRKKVTAAFDGGRLSSDSGVMLLALADRRAQTLSASVERTAAEAASCPHLHPVISGISSPYRVMNALWSMSLSRMACLA